MWELATGKKVAAIETEIDTFLTSPDGSTLVTWLLDDKLDRDWLERHRARIPDRGLEVWSLPGGRRLFRLEWDSVGVRRATFSPDGRILATWLDQEAQPTKNEREKLELFDAETGETRHIQWSAVRLQNQRAATRINRMLDAANLGLGNVEFHLATTVGVM